MYKTLAKILSHKHMTDDYALRSGNKTIKRWLQVIGGLALLGSISSAYSAAPITTQGNQVLFGGQVGSIAGNSMFWSNNGWGGDRYYNAGVINWLHTDWKSRLVRAAMGIEDGGGYLDDPTANFARVKTVVDAAIANDMYVIIDWHSHHAEWNTARAVTFFTQMAQTYRNVPNVIFEIYNEPLNTVSWSGVIKPYAVQVIAAIRGQGANNLIVVGTSSWSQDVDLAANDPITGYANIAYALHFYVGMHGQSLRDKAATALRRGLPLFVTEWGVWGPNVGDINMGEFNAWKNFLKNNNISNASWGLTDKYEQASLLVPGASVTGGWPAGQLTNVGVATKDWIANWGGPTGPATCTEVNLPATIQAEQYCEMVGVQTEATTDVGGGQNVGWIDAGDWLSYQVRVPAAGTYRVTYRVAGQNGGGILRLENTGGTPVYANTNFTGTGGWQTWVDLTQVVTLPAGSQRISIAAPVGGYNLNWFRIEPISISSSSSSTSSSSSSSAPLVTIEAETWGSMNGVQTEPTSDVGGGLNVGWIDSGDWISYSNRVVNIPQTGAYVIELRVASLTGGGVLAFEENGGTVVHGVANIPSTGGWQNWATVRLPVNLTAGNHSFGVNARTGGFNFNWFRIVRQ